MLENQQKVTKHNKKSKKDKTNIRKIQKNRHKNTKISQNMSATYPTGWQFRKHNKEKMCCKLQNTILIKKYNYEPAKKHQKTERHTQKKHKTQRNSEETQNHKQKKLIVFCRFPLWFVEQNVKRSETQ